ncbi:hypothetical protein LEMLEM_LOCUS17679 [Lemmus lemmus]
MTLNHCLSHILKAGIRYSLQSTNQIDFSCSLPPLCPLLGDPSAMHKGERDP